MHIDNRFWTVPVAAMLVVGGLAAGPTVAAEEPPALLLTWQQDPTTTMTIDWHTEPTEDGGPPASILQYQAVGEEEWRSTEAAQHAFPHSDRTIHRIELTGLEPGSTYRFRVGDFERPYKFRTMPDDISKPVVFATGGDTRHRQEWMERTNSVAMRYDLDFIVWGGDLSYADGREDRVDRWYEWFDANMNTLISDEGRVVPIIAGIGNHEMLRPRGGNYYYNFPEFDDAEEFAAYEGDIEQWRRENAPYYFALFAFPGQPGYGVLDFADYLSILALDSNHANPVEGEQTQWLEQVLAEREGVPHIFPVYHVPMFPSVRSDGQSARSWPWRPLFEQYGVRLAFENHDHAYKRTHPIRNDQIDPTGVVYIGDGAWGVGTREVHDPDESWYLKRAKSERHAIIVTLQGSHQHVRVVNEDGHVIDEYPAAGDPGEATLPQLRSLTLQRSTPNLVQAPLPDDGQWSISQRGDSTGDYDVTTLDKEPVVRLRHLHHDDDRPRFRIDLSQEIPNDQQLLAVYGMRVRANEPTRLRSRLHGSGGTITETHTHQVTTDWKYVLHAQQLSHSRDYTQTLKLSLDSEEDYDGVEIYLNDISVHVGSTD